MGYTTEFSGHFKLNKKLTPELHEYLNKFNQTRRMRRKVDAKYGIEGEWYVDGTGFMGQDDDGTVTNSNSPPATQPSLWCQWRPTEDGMGIEWDGGEKFYCYTEWMNYIYVHFLKPNGYVLSGSIAFQGEEQEDCGVLAVDDTSFMGVGDKPVRRIESA